MRHSDAETVRGRFLMYTGGARITGYAAVTCAVRCTGMFPQLMSAIIEFGLGAQMIGLCRFLGIAWVALVSFTMLFSIVMAVKEGDPISLWHYVILASFMLPGIGLAYLAKWLKRRAKASPRN